MIQIEMENGKTMTAELYPEIAPISVANFEKLISEGFYDGLIFHRVISGFMIQGGCPDGTGMGGPGYNIKGEFSSNGVKNDLKHTKGVLSMARSSAPDSAGSQFFIMHETAPHLDGSYAAFGKVIDGLDVLEEIAATPVGNGDKPRTAQVIKKITIISDGKPAANPVKDEASEAVVKPAAKAKTKSPVKAKAKKKTATKK